jgi:hypothetical protein
VGGEPDLGSGEECGCGRAILVVEWFGVGQSGAPGHDGVHEHVLSLVNRFTPTADGTGYVSEVTIGVPRLAGFNRMLRSRILGGDMALAWVRHHIEEVGNFEHFLASALCVLAVILGVRTEHRQPERLE